MVILKRLVINHLIFYDFVYLKSDHISKKATCMPYRKFHKYFSIKILINGYKTF